MEIRPATEPQSCQRPSSHLPRSRAALSSVCWASPDASPALLMSAPGRANGASHVCQVLRRGRAGHSTSTSRRRSWRGASARKSRRRPSRTSPAPTTTVNRIPGPVPVKASWPEDDETGPPPDEAFVTKAGVVVVVDPERGTVVVEEPERDGGAAARIHDLGRGGGRLRRRVGGDGEAPVGRDDPDRAATATSELPARLLSAPVFGCPPAIQ